MKKPDDVARCAERRRCADHFHARRRARRFFGWVTRIAMGVIGVGLAVPLIGYVVSPALKRHGLHGEGGKVGPDLSYVGNRRPDRDWHIRHLRDPASVSPGSIMPRFPLSDREVNDLASYLLSLKGEAATPTEETLETDETGYALLPYVGVAVSCQACVEAQEGKEQI